MASIRKRGERYYIRYRDAAGVQHEVAAGTKDRKRAADMARRLADKLETGYTPPGRRLTVAEAWELFDTTVLPGKREGTRIGYRSAMRANWLPAIGPEVLATLRPEQVRKALDGMPLAASTKGLRRNQLSGLYKWAMAEGHAFSNPCRDVHIEGKRNPVPDTLAPRYLRLLVDHAPAETRAAIMVLAYAGLRAGELRALTWPDFHADTLTLTICKTVYREGREAIVRHGRPFSDPKSTRGNRTVDIPEALAVELNRWRKASANRPRKWDLIFPSAWGGPLRNDALNRYVREAAVILAARPEVAPEHRQGDEEELDAECITPRTLRHAYARLMLMLGMSLPELQRLMGHAKFDTTLRYAHYEAKDRPLAVRALDTWGGLGGKPGRYLPVDMDDRRKHAIGLLEGRDVANAKKRRVGNVVGSSAEPDATPLVSDTGSGAA